MLAHSDLHMPAYAPANLSLPCPARVGARFCQNNPYTRSSCVASTRHAHTHTHTNDTRMTALRACVVRSVTLFAENFNAVVRLPLDLSCLHAGLVRRIAAGARGPIS